SFMHPPFGFALFYLRGIADTLFKNKSLPRRVESRDIYMGAIPFIVIQLILVAIVIFFPQTVTVFLDKEQVLDINKAGEAIEQMGGGNYTDTAPQAELPAGGASDAQPSDPLQAPNADEKKEESDDPMKAVEDALKKEAGKK
ncbi:MAG: TRAP transporter large permease subunit, partial [Pseudomonadota bacterium]